MVGWWQGELRGLPDMAGEGAGRLRGVVAGCVVAMVVTGGCVVRVPPDGAGGPPSPAPAGGRPSGAQPPLRSSLLPPLMVPVDGVAPEELRDSFSALRGEGRTHRAIDIPASRGTPVLAAVEGEVFRLSQNASGGITAYLLDQNRRFLYYYAHLDGYSNALTEGLKVKRGFVIGFVGTSGNAPPDTPHLHFQVMHFDEGGREWWNGTAVDVRGAMKFAGRARW